MAWTNIFDLGPCTVELWQYGSFIEPADYASNDFEVLVEDGTVTVRRSEGSLDALEVVVRPDFPTLQRPVRVLNMETYEADFYEINDAWVSSGQYPDAPISQGWGVPGGVEGVDQGDGIFHYVPDPAEFTDFEGLDWYRAGVTTRAGD